MTNFTYCSLRKSFFIALAVMVSGLFVLRFSSANNYTARTENQGQSIVTLKNIYRSASERSSAGLRALEWKAGIKKVTYRTENYFHGDKSIDTKE
jgi:hypothetical protein